MGLLGFLKKKEATPVPVAEESSFYNRRVKVAGVTFKNDDGSSRQDILKSIYEKKKPFNQQLNVSIEGTEYEGNPAYKVLVNGFCVGMVESKMSAFIAENKDRLRGISDFRVGCFDENDTGEEYNENHKVKMVYSARMKILVEKK